MKKNLALSILTGLLFALSLPPFKTGVLAYVALIPFFILLEEKSLKEAFRWGYVTGLFVDIGSLFWIGWVTLPGCIGALLILPFFVALYALLHTFLVQRLSLLAYFFSPFLWSSIEYLQSFGETAFPWNLLGYSQSYYIRLIQYAEYTSVYGVSFLGCNTKCPVVFILQKNTLFKDACHSVRSHFIMDTDPSDSR